jgi:hypothetical protein
MIMGGSDIRFGNAAIAAGAKQSTDPSGLPNIIKAIELELGLKMVKAPDISLDTIGYDSD